jgi:hypothetical protein
MLVALCKSENNSVYDYIDIDPETYTPPEGWFVVDADTARSMSSFYIPDLKAHIANIRWTKEEQGIMVGPYFVPTERIERGTILAMQFNAVFKPDIQINYKPKGTNQTHIINAATAIRLAECSAWYVEACFAVEKALCDAYDAGMPKDAVLALADTLWPQTQFDLTPPG